MNGLIVQGTMAEWEKSLTTEQLSREAEEVKAAVLDVQAFRPLYERYYKRVVGFVYNRVEEKELAFEISAQVFFEAIHSLHRYKHKGVPFSAWLFRIALNLLGKHFRSGSIRRTVSLHEEGIKFLEEESNTIHSDAELYAILQTLHEDELLLVELRFFEGKAFSEIAEILSGTESAVKQRMYKILEVMKNRFNALNQ